MKQHRQLSQRHVEVAIGSNNSGTQVAPASLRRSKRPPVDAAATMVLFALAKVAFAAVALASSAFSNFCQGSSLILPLALLWKMNQTTHMPQKNAVTRPQHSAQ
mmetsp:Transcript_6197/g.17030  ORF Transcript_6197/g.17030 Transcript_6197/m.17030 type:complete len:104 (-) Transcript_6197:133-444(-)